MKKHAFLTGLFLLSAGLAANAGWTPQAFSADYRLMFNEKLVGRAFFRLELQEDHNYSFEVFTIPAGEVADEHPDHEVLEGSNGRLDNGLPVPDSYYYSVRDESGIRLLEFFFLWPEQELRINTDDQQHVLELASGTQDRLSYLLNAMKLAGGNLTEVSFPLSTPDNTRETRLRVGIQKNLKVPAGTLRSIKVERFQGNGKADRILWLAVNKGNIPALLENITPKGTARMELVKFSLD